MQLDRVGRPADGAVRIVQQVAARAVHGTAAARRCSPFGLCLRLLYGLHACGSWRPHPRSVPFAAGAAIAAVPQVDAATLMLGYCSNSVINILHSIFSFRPQERRCVGCTLSQKAPLFCVFIFVSPSREVFRKSEQHTIYPRAHSRTGAIYQLEFGKTTDVIFSSNHQEVSCSRRRCLSNECRSK